MLNALNTRALQSMIGLVQIFDIFVHVSTNQAEPLRIASNVIILLWLVLVALNRASLKKNFVPVAVAVVVTYLLLNGIFVSIHGFTNPMQGGEPRTVMFLLVGVTTVFSAAFSYLKKQPDKA